MSLEQHMFPYGRRDGLLKDRERLTKHLAIMSDNYLKQTAVVARQHQQITEMYEHIDALTEELMDIKYAEIQPVLECVKEMMDIVADIYRYHEYKEMEYTVGVRVPTIRVHTSRQAKLEYMDKVQQKAASMLADAISEKLMEVTFTKRG